MAQGTAKPPKRAIEDYHLEAVENFTYLGSTNYSLLSIDRGQQQDREGGISNHGQSTPESMNELQLDREDQTTRLSSLCTEHTPVRQRIMDI